MEGVKYMKKIVVTLSAIIALSIATGCGSKNKSLECSIKQEQTGMTMNQTEIIKFNGSTVESYKEEVKVELDEAYSSYKDLFIKTFKEEMDQYKDIKGVKIDTKETDSGLEATMTADVKTMSESDLKKLDLDKKASYELTKKDREDKGYTCK
jgi:uncharacterized lipoprotein YehR (DUF1307 family)